MFGIIDTVDYISFSGEETEQLNQAAQQYVDSVEDMMQKGKAAGLSLGNLYGAECTFMQKQYRSNGEALVCAGSCGYEVYKEEFEALSDTVYWSMPYVYTLHADSVGQYRELFDVFRKVTEVSRE